MNERIQELIENICDDLEIDVPTVSNDTSMFPTSTTMAIADVEAYTIYIREQKTNPDVVFAIIHELRHLWQWKTDKMTYFDGYKKSTELSIEEYNLQIAEIDANAYGAVVINVKVFFPIFKRLHHVGIYFDCHQKSC